MKTTLRMLLIAMGVGMFIMRPVLSYADWNSNNGNNGNWHGNSSSGNSHTVNSHDSHGHDNHGYDGHGHDRGYSYAGVNLSIWPDSYYYGMPYYPPTDEVFVSQPVYQPVVVNGITYYVNNGAYYVYNGYGYQAVAPPVTVVQQPVTVVQPQTAVAPVVAGAGDADPITINIPNSKGGYTAVTLKRSGNGYIGPQGEFYPEFPKVYQLEIIYGK